MSETSCEMHGAEAVRFASERLTRVRVDQETWEVEYLDEATGEKWLMDYPNSALQGGGSPRLRRLPLQGPEEDAGDPTAR